MLLQGDCLEVMNKIPNQSVDMILCDLPYGTTYSKWDRIINSKELWKQYKRVLKPNGSAVLFASGQFVPRLMLSNLDWYKYEWIWVKNNSTNFVHAKNRPMTKHENILVFSSAPMGHKSQLGNKRMTYNPQGLTPVNKIVKAGKGRFGTVAGIRPSHKQEFLRTFTGYPNDVLLDFAEPPANVKVHTNQKPIKLLEFMIKTYTDEGMTVLDNCMGSGSTGIACVNTNRKFIGIELDEKYFEIAKQRIENAEQEEQL